MGKDKDKEKDRDKDKEKKKDKKEKKKDKSHRERSSRHRHRRHDSEGGSDEEKHSSKRHHRSSPSSKRDKDRHREEKLKRSRSPDEHEEDIISKRSHIEEKDERKEETSIQQREERGGGGAGLELSIEETNKLRLELGLKPLQVESTVVTEKTGVDGDKDDDQEEEEAPKKKEDVHVPAKNIGDMKKAEKIREKIEMMREARGLVRKLGTVRGLGEGKDGSTDNGKEEDSASDWVKKMREKEKEKKLAEQRARLLEEMDEGNEAGEEEEEERGLVNKDSYSSHHLAGLTVEHKGDRFQEGRDVVLTLKDAQILDNEDDVLVNVNMIDEEKGQRNIELRKTLPGYQPYDEEFDEYGNPITRSLLYKYDEEIEGQKVNKFVLGESGDYKIGEVQKEKEKARDLLQQKAVTLDIPELSVASEYYTAEEMVQFRKRKKRKRKEKFKVDELVSLDKEESGQDHGSRQHRREEPIDDESVPMETDIKPDPSLLDESDSKVDSALERTRRLLSRKAGPPQSTGAARVASMLGSKPVKIKTEEPDENELLVNKNDDDDSGPIIIDTTSEFCRQIGEEDFTGDEIKVKQERDDSEAMDEGDLLSGGWAEIDPNRKEEESVPEKPDVLELEAKTHLTGVAAALQMASKKGFIDVEKDNTVKRKGDSKTIIHGLGTRDWEYERDRGRERDKDKDSHGREITFCEKKDYIPDVKIEYVDDKGKLLTAKEAFRHMSHKFHGKGSGKKKVEKLIKRRKEEILLSKSDAGDTPLQSLEMLRKKQEFSQSAFVVLTGQQQQTFHTTELAKRK